MVPKDQSLSNKQPDCLSPAFKWLPFSKCQPAWAQTENEEGDAPITAQLPAGLFPFLLQRSHFFSFLQTVNWPHIVRPESGCTFLPCDRVADQRIDYPSVLSNWDNSPHWTACHGHTWRGRGVGGEWVNRNFSQLQCPAIYVIFKNSCQVGIITIRTTKTLQLCVWWLLVRHLSI